MRAQAVLEGRLFCILLEFSAAFCQVKPLNLWPRRRWHQAAMRARAVLKGGFPDHFPDHFHAAA